MILQEVLADLDATITDADADIQHSTLPVIDGYPTEMKRLFQNLIINAIKFRKKDSKPQMKISGEKINDNWEFSFNDNGIGIEKKNTEEYLTFFSVYIQELSMKVLASIVELHNRKIWVQSMPGEGSTFHLLLE